MSVTGSYTCVYFFESHDTQVSWLWLYYCFWFLSLCYIGAVSIPILWLWQNLLLYCLILSLEKAGGRTLLFILNTVPILISVQRQVSQSTLSWKNLRWPGHLWACYGRQCFKPALKRELYLIELATRQRLTESWTNFADDLRRLFLTLCLTK